MTDRGRNVATDNVQKSVDSYTNYLDELFDKVRHREGVAPEASTSKLYPPVVFSVIHYLH